MRSSPTSWRTGQGWHRPESPIVERIQGHRIVFRFAPRDATNTDWHPLSLVIVPESVLAAAKLERLLAALHRARDSVGDPLALECAVYQ